MSIKALIWDVEGVLLATNEGSIEMALAEHLNVPLEAVGNIFHGKFNDQVDMGEFTQRDFWLHALDILGLPHSRLPDMEVFFHEKFFIDQDLMDKVRQYRKQYKTALLSNFSEVMRPMLETSWNVEGAFDEIIISCEVKMIKPQPQIFDFTLKKLNVSKEEAVLIDDRIVNIRGALDYGMRSVHFRTREQAINDLEKLIAANNSGYKQLENIIVE